MDFLKELNSLIEDGDAGGTTAGAVSGGAGVATASDPDGDGDTDVSGTNSGGIANVPFKLFRGKLVKRRIRKFKPLSPMQRFKNKKKK